MSSHDLEDDLDKQAQAIADSVFQKEETSEVSGSASEEDPRILELTNSLSEAEAKATKHWDMLLRKEAEAQNLQRRARLDVENAHKFAIEKFALDLLKVMDTFDSAMDAHTNDVFTEPHALAFFEGMALTHKVMEDVLQKAGIVILNPKGEPFNPEFHEALTMLPTNDVPDHHVIQVIQRGYTLNGRLLRAARVIVAQSV